MDSPARCVSPTSQFELVLVHRISSSLAPPEENESILSHYQNSEIKPEATMRSNANTGK